MIEYFGLLLLKCIVHNLLILSSTIILISIIIEYFGLLTLIGISASHKILLIFSITIIFIAIMIAYFGSLFVIGRNALIAKNYLPTGIGQNHNFNSNNDRTFWFVISNLQTIY